MSKTPHNKRAFHQTPKKHPTHQNGIPIKVEEDSIILYKYMSWAAFEATIKNWSLKACLAYEANDPLEFAPQSTDEYSPIDFSIQQTGNNPPPFISFSRKITSSAMWGHYSDSGKGVCLVFSFPCESYKNEQELIFFSECKNARIQGTFRNQLEQSYIAKVKYQEERIRVDSTDTDPQIRYHNLITTKGTAWAFEDEYRLISDYRNAQSASNGILSFSWPMAFLIGVITGPRCSYPPHYVQQMLTKRYNAIQSAVPNYHINSPLFNHTFIVSSANYHWKRFEIEAPPWSDNLDNMNLLASYFAYIAMRNHSPLPELDGKTGERTVVTPKGSWNDFIKGHLSESAQVFAVDEGTLHKQREIADRSSHIATLITKLRSAN